LFVCPCDKFYCIISGTKIPYSIKTKTLKEILCNLVHDKKNLINLNMIRQVHTVMLVLCKNKQTVFLIAIQSKYY